MSRTSLPALTRAVAAGLRRHFEGYRRRSPWSFCWRISIESILVGLLAVAILFPFVPIERRALLDMPYYQLLLLAVGLAPVLETLLGQLLPVELVRLFKGGFRWQIATALVVFAAPHFAQGVAVGVGAGVIGGLYFAFTYAHWRERSLWTALWTTVVCHGIHNAVPILLVFPRWLSG
ncbi:MAG: hypothetical protein PVH47_00585 [Thiohalocapsa sp.]|jgi:hypothetical protein